MAPPRTTKTSSLTISQTASRQGHEQSRTQVVEEIEELDDVDDTNSTDIDDEAEEAGTEAPQDTSTDPLQQLIGNMVDDQRKRFAARKKAVKDSHTANCTLVQKSITRVFDEHEEKASSAHQAQLKRLHELLIQKADIEAAMEEKLASLRADYDAHSRDLERVVASRIKELK